MRFGLQKMTLLDYPGKMACTVFTNGCNFRCPFCHNGSLVRAGSEGTTLEQSELLRFLEKRRGILEGVCITGGEPLLHDRELFAFMVEVRAMDLAVKLDTNGTFPDRLKYAVENGLVNYVAMDVKNSPGKYARTAGISGGPLLDCVNESIDFLLHCDAEYEFRTTVVKNFHVPADFQEIGKRIRNCRQYFLQKFVDSGDLLTDAAKLGALSDEEMQACLQNVLPYVPNAQLRGVN